MGVSVVNTFEAQTLPLYAKFSKIVRNKKLQIIGSLSPDAKAAVEAAFSAASDLESCAKLLTENVDVQVWDLLSLKGTSTGAAALYNFISLCNITSDRKIFHIYTGYVDIKGGINAISGVEPKTLIASRFSIPLLMPSGNKVDYERLLDDDPSYNVIFLSNAREMEKLIQTEKVEEPKSIRSIFNSFW